MASNDGSPKDTIPRELDDIINDLGVVLQRIESLDKRIKVISTVTESAVSQVIQIEKELGSGETNRKKQRRTRRIIGR